MTTDQIHTKWITTPMNREAELDTWNELYDMLLPRPADAVNPTKGDA